MSPQIELSTFLRAIERRWRWLMGLHAVAAAAFGASLVCAALAAAAWLLDPPSTALLVMALAASLAAMVWIVRALRPAMRAPEPARLARYVEERRPEFEDALVTAVQVRHGDHAFARAIVADAAIQARGVAPSSIVGRGELQRAAGRGAAACALLLVTGGASLGTLERAFDAARVRLFPSRISIEVEPGDARVVQGQAVRLRARISGLPASLDPDPIVDLRAGSSSKREPMRTDGAAFVFTVPDVSTTFSYAISAAGVRSPEYTVTVLRRPALQGIDVSYEYPAYTGMPARDERDGGDIYAPAGTRVTVRVRADKPLNAAALRFGERTLALGAGATESVREARFTVDRDGSYRMDLVDTDGLRSAPSSEYFVQVTDDRPPEVRILRPEHDRQVTPLEEVEVEASAEDDYRLSGLELVYAVGGRPETVVPLDRGGGPSLAGGHLLFLEELGVRPGDMVRAYARAREARRGGREARSEMLLLEVMPFDQQFALAQSQSDGGGGRGGDLDSLIQAEKNILNGTWNLLRRAAAGRSEADITALAGAQRELRARTQMMAGRGGGDNPMARAAAAMGRAEEALQRKQLQEAVPQEMEALSQLGRALAENRRREVSQQRGGGGGGGNRSSQDLSALFDRELLRQQQTNYENRQSASSEQRQESESDLQKRVRELARRQDELARSQRQLAAQRLSDEERRRQLERLTREQEELRQRAEQLARDLQRGQRGEQGREQSERLREAAEEMRAATGDLRRQDPQSASDRGSRAAERLRGAEEQAAGGSGQTSSAGELQLEARQLAEAQRRVERQQAAAGGSETADRQALAEEQGRLADRAQRLERAARELSGRGADQRQRQAAAQASRALQRERVAERMRENAEALRGAERSRAGSNAPTPQEGASTGAAGSPRPAKTPAQTPGGELSSALERVARGLGAATDAETQRIAEELARNRAARERLEEMARRLERAQRDGNAEAQGDLRRELQRAEQMLRQLQQAGRPDSGTGETTPEQHEWSTSAPGLESFKQDFARWEQLKRNLSLALEQRDLALARKLRGGTDPNGVNAGSVEGLPEEYRARVARYFEALARAGKRP